MDAETRAGPHSRPDGDAGGTARRRRRARRVTDGVFALPRPPGAGTATHAELLPAALRGVYESMATGEGLASPVATPPFRCSSGAVSRGRSGSARADAHRCRRDDVALIGLSRLVLGVHYLADIVAGFAIAGTALVLALSALRTPARPRLRGRHDEEGSVSRQPSTSPRRRGCRCRRRPSGASSTSFDPGIVPARCRYPALRALARWERPG